MNKKNKFQFLNISIDNVKFEDFLESLNSGVVVTPNVDHLIKLQKDRNFYQSYKKADHIICDSRILKGLSKFLNPNEPIKDQIAGSDLFPLYCSHHKNNTKHVRVFLLGGTPETVQIAKNNLNKKNNTTIIIAGYSPPFGFENNELERDKIIQLINDSGATVLAIGVGAPKQENWLAQNRSCLPNIHTFFAIGATIEFEAGGLTRAPRWMTKIGLEWLYRLGQEPKRMFKRYVLEDSVIFWLCIKQKLGLYKDPFADQ